MGGSMNVRCTSCGFSGEEQAWGSGMMMAWDFFENRLFRCLNCKRLETGYVIKTLPALRAAAKPDYRTGWPGPFTLSRDELAEMLIDARQRPRCSVCNRALSGRSVGGEGPPTRCPNCGGDLVTEFTGLCWD